MLIEFNWNTFNTVTYPEGANSKGELVLTYRLKRRLPKDARFYLRNLFVDSGDGDTSRQTPVFVNVFIPELMSNNSQLTSVQGNLGLVRAGIRFIYNVHPLSSAQTQNGYSRRQTLQDTMAFHQMNIPLGKLRDTNLHEISCVIVFENFTLESGLESATPKDKIRRLQVLLEVVKN